MDYDFSEDIAKIWPALVAIGAFVAVVAGVLFVLDVLPRWGKGRERWHAIGFLGPAAVLLLIGLIIPLIRTTYLSFFNADGSKFIGVENYKWIFTQSDTLIMLRNTLFWVICVPLLSTSVGLLYAVLVDKARFEAVAKSLIFMPMAISLVGASIIWKFVYAFREPGEKQIGLLNQVFVWLGMQPKQVLSNEPANTFYLIVMLIWIQAGYPWQMFWRVTMPSIRPSLLVVVITITIGTLKIFDIVRTSTNGQFKTNVLAFEMYAQAFRSFDDGKGAALAVLLFLLVVPVVIYQARQLRQRMEIR